MAPGLAKLIRPLAQAAPQARRELGLDDLRRLPANDNFEIDPLDVADLALSLGEAAPAALFLFPMWAAASTYLKDPQYYLSKPRSQCGDDAQSRKKGRPLEWAPLRRFAPTPHDYRNPRLSDAERQKLVEWFAPATRRGEYTGAEGLPKGLPQDPKRDDSFAAPINPRNMVIDRPLDNALPATERALPDLQQDDVQRRLMMGDAVPGRAHGIGDFAGATPGEKNAQDFLAASAEPEPNLSVSGHVVDIRMQKGGRPPSDNKVDEKPNGPFAEAMMEFILHKRRLAHKLQQFESDAMDHVLGVLGLMDLRELDRIPQPGRLILELQRRLTQLRQGSPEWQQQVVMGLASEPNVRAVNSVVQRLREVASQVGADPKMAEEYAEKIYDSTPISWRNWTPPGLDAIYADYSAKMAEAESNPSRAGKEFEPSAPREVPRAKKFVPGKPGGNGDKKIKFGRAAAKAGKKTGVALGHYSSHPFASDPFATDPARAIGFSKAVPGPIFRMSDGADIHRLDRPVGHGSYADRFRAANGRGNGKAVPPNGHDAPPVHTPSQDVLPTDTGHRKHGVNSGMVPVRVTTLRPSLNTEKPRRAELQKWDDVLAKICAAWPKVEGRLRTESKSASMIQRPIQYDDGEMDFRTILRHHSWAVERFNKEETVADRIAHPASYYTQDYLLWAMERATGAAIQLDRVYGRPSDTIVISLNKPNLAKSGVAEAILREVWPQLKEGARITKYSFQDRSGKQTRMIRALEIYWKGLKDQLTREGKWTPQIPPEAGRLQSLQLMHRTLFGTAILEAGQVAYYPDLPMPVPPYGTLDGILKIADAVSRLPFVRAAQQFPSHYGRRNEVVVLADGTVIRYETVLERLTELVARAKVEGNPRVADLEINPVYLQMAREDLELLRVAKASGKPLSRVIIRSRTAPNEAARKAFYEWFLKGQKSTIVRRRSEGDGSKTVRPIFKHHDDVTMLSPYASDPVASSSFAADPFTSDPLRAIGFTKAAPGPVIHRMSDGGRQVRVLPMRQLKPKLKPTLPRHAHHDRPQHMDQGARKAALLRQTKTQWPLRSTELPPDTVKVPIEFRLAHQLGAIPKGEEPDGIPVGRLMQLDQLKVWRLNTNVLFVRPDDNPQNELVSLFFKANEIPGYPELREIITLDNLRFMVRERKSATIYTHINGVDYPVLINPVYQKYHGGERVHLEVTSPTDQNHGTIIPWHPRWMTASPLEELVGSPR